MKVGILGGGQLGVMLAEALERLSVDFALYDPDPVAPAKQRWPQHTTTGSWDDLEGLAIFFETSTVITYESENVLTAPFHALDVADRVFPALDVLETVQDRIREKTFLSRNKLPHVAFRALKDIADLPHVAPEFGYPFIVKSARGGYDGKGQYRIENEAQLKTLPPLQAGVAGWWVIEEIVDIALEVSCIVGRNRNDEEVTFPLFENLHRNHILDLSSTPARIPDELSKAIEEVALNAARVMGVQGILTVEFFITRNPGVMNTMRQCGEWYFGVNEFAPRPHNSGHVTRAATQYSQFDILARILTNRSLEKPQFVDRHFYCMGQLLGEVWLAQQRQELDIRLVKTSPEVVELMDYGKKAIRAQRKMGHYIVKGDTIDDALDKAIAFRARLSQPVQE